MENKRIWSNENRFLETRLGPLGVSEDYSRKLLIRTRLKYLHLKHPIFRN